VAGGAEGFQLVGGAAGAGGEDPHWSPPTAFCR
jgi:hypothetical protein